MGSIRECMENRTAPFSLALGNAWKIGLTLFSLRPFFPCLGLLESQLINNNNIRESHVH
jgi:hypothetical protein